MEVAKQPMGKPKMLVQDLQKENFNQPKLQPEFGKWKLMNVPEAATSLTGLFCSLAMNPMTEKIANPEKKLVPELMAQTSSDCL